MLVQNVNNVRFRDVVHREIDCQTYNSVLRCQHHIPLKIPRGITEVYIKDLITTNEESRKVTLNYLILITNYLLIKTPIPKQQLPLPQWKYKLCFENRPVTHPLFYLKQIRVGSTF